MCFWSVILFSLFQTFSAEDQSQAYKYLANYHLQRNHLDDAYAAAQKCTEFPEVCLCESCLAQVQYLSKSHLTSVPSHSSHISFQVTSRSQFCLPLVPSHSSLISLPVFSSLSPISHPVPSHLRSVSIPVLFHLSAISLPVWSNLSPKYR